MTSRASRLRRRRADGITLRQLAREFGLSKTRIIQILQETGGDPLRSSDLAVATVPDLDNEIHRLRDRIASDRRRLRAVLDELDSRATDRILGLA